MWYVVVLLICGVWSNCWAMNGSLLGRASQQVHGRGSEELVRQDYVRKINDGSKDIQRVSCPDEISTDEIKGLFDLKKDEQCISANGILEIERGAFWNLYDKGSTVIRKYHLTMAQYYQTLHSTIDQREPGQSALSSALSGIEHSKKMAFHAACLKYLHEVPQITFVRDRLNDSNWLYAFNNALIAIKSDTLEDPAILSSPNRSDRFTAYSIDNGRVFATDNTCKVYEWVPHSQWQGAHQLPGACKEVTAIQQLNTPHALAIFFKDNNNKKRAGFLLSKNGGDLLLSVVPSEERIDSITWVRDQQNRLSGSILCYEDHLYRVIAKYNIRRMTKPNEEPHVEFIIPKTIDPKL